MMIKQKAFTLIELMIVVAIVGILAGIAYPSYQDSVRKSRRADAEGALLGFANAMERYFTENNNYCDAGGHNDASGNATGSVVANCGTATKDTGAPTVFAIQSPLDGTTKYYDLSIAAVSPTTFTLKATPIGAQAGDGFLQITNTQSRGGWDRDDNGTISGANEVTWD